MKDEIIVPDTLKNNKPVVEVVYLLILLSGVGVVIYANKKNKRKSLIILGAFLIVLSFSILFLKCFNLYKNDEKEQKSLEEFYIKEKLAKMKDDNINSSIKVNNELDQNISETRNELNRLLKEKEDREKENKNDE